MDRWAGRTAVVTGASAGIGAAACLALADAGMRVVGLARRTHMIDDLTPQIKGSGSITSRQCDVSNLEEVAAVFAWVQERFGGTDVLINNAGIFRSGHITDVGDAKLSDEDILSIIDVNFKAVVMCARHAIASMRTRGVDGHIVNINSVAGHYQPVTPEFNIYPATKHAVTAATKSLLGEISSFQNKIKVTSISPGLVETEMTAEFLASAPVPALKAKDIADAVLYAVGTPANVNYKLDGSDSESDIGAGSDDAGNLSRSRRQRAAERFVAVSYKLNTFYRVAEIAARAAVALAVAVAAVQFAALH